MTVVRPDIKFTEKEYRALPESGPRYQLIEGELLMSPAPTLRHQQVMTRIAAALLAFVEPRKLGIVVASPVDVYLTEHDVLQPDVAFLSTARRSIAAKEGFRGGPDLVVEGLSPSTATLDLGPKRVLYARHGVAEYWIVEPEANWLDRYRLQENAERPERRFGPAETLSTPLLPGFSLDLAAVFAP